jgi:hypothetical protein
MDLQLAALILVPMLLVWLFIRRQRDAAKKTATKPGTRGGKNNTAYHAVSIKFADTACTAAQDLEGRRFLSTAAPRLPLPECDVPDCNCRFVHHKDRRAGKDRRSPFGPGGIGGSTGKYAQEQRHGKDRRHSDDEDDF